MRSTNKTLRLSAAVCAMSLALAGVTAACAQAAPADAGGDLVQVSRLEEQDQARIAAVEAALAEQGKVLAEQKAVIDEQQREIAELRTSLAANVDAVRAAGIGGAGASSPSTIVLADNAAPAPGSPAVTAAQSEGGSSPTPPPPTAKPVGEAPEAAPPPQLALPVGVNVLTPRHHFVFETGMVYQNASSDRLVFEGVEIDAALLVGLIQDSKTANNSFTDTNTVRYGIANRLEIEGVVPIVERHDRVTTLQTANSQLAQTYTLTGGGLGDVEGTLRYQITSGVNGAPIVIGNLRVKSDSGVGPFGVKFNQFGTALSLPAGSGFWATEPSLTVVVPSDPVVIFGNIGYLYNFARTFNKTIFAPTGATTIGRVSPGNSIDGAVGFAFSANAKFSYSLGYKDSYFFPTETVINRLKVASTSLQAGSLLLGASYRLTDRLSINANFEFGVTVDAPSDTITIRIPYTF
jgi:uncharacterized coiled-coil protein SlyX